MSTMPLFLALMCLIINLSLVNGALANPAEDTIIGKTPSKLVVPVGDQSQDLRKSMALPEPGNAMDSVRTLLGNPTKTDAVGNPVITRWYYPNKGINSIF